MRTPTRQACLVIVFALLAVTGCGEGGESSASGPTTASTSKTDPTVAGRDSGRSAVPDAAPVVSPVCDGSCVTAAPKDCGSVPNGSSETRIRFQSATEPAGGVCVRETQERHCADGIWSDWSGTFAAEACTVTSLTECADGGTEARLRFEAPSVPFGSSCVQETQSRACSGGRWSSWSGTFLAEDCVVGDPAPCGTSINGAVETRIRYASDTVPFGSSCVPEAQTRTCTNGSWSSWTGTYSAPACSVGTPATCGGTAHGASETRTRYLKDKVGIGEPCTSETQSRVCDNGTWGAWSGSYQYATCAVDASTDPFRGVGQLCDVLADCVGALACHTDTTTFRSHRQCTAACANDLSCTGLYGNNTTCLSTGVCAAKCLTDAACPTGTLCNAEGWCSRSAPDSGNPYCDGNALSCLSLTQSVCDAAPVSCHWGLSSTNRCRLAGAFYPCSSYTNATAAYCDGIGCGWQGGACVSRLPGSCTNQSSSTCASYHECYYGGGDECLGVAPACVKVPVDVCTKQPGCVAMPAKP